MFQACWLSNSRKMPCETTPIGFSRTCMARKSARVGGELCFVACSASVPNSSGWKISPLAEEARGEESDDEEDKSTDDEREEGGVEVCGGAQGGRVVNAVYGCTSAEM